MERTKKRTRETESSKLFQFISENQGLNAQEISDRLGWTRSKTNRMLTILEKKGRIIRRIYSAAQPTIAVKTEAARHQPIMVTKQEAIKQQLSGKFMRLETWKAKLEAREKELFDKCVAMQMQGDQTAANMYASQCAEVRKIIKLVNTTEEVLTRLTTPGE